MVAARMSGVRALALMAPPGRPLDAIIIEQEQASMRRFGLSQAEIDANVAELHATYEAVRAGKRLPASLSPAERRGIAESATWLRSHFRHAPLAEAAALSRIPVLVTAGGRDVQIATADAEITRDAFLGGGNKLVTYKSLSRPQPPVRRQQERQRRRLLRPNGRGRSGLPRRPGGLRRQRHSLPPDYDGRRGPAAPSAPLRSSFTSTARSADRCESEGAPALPQAAASVDPTLVSRGDQPAAGIGESKVIAAEVVDLPPEQARW